METVAKIEKLTKAYRDGYICYDEYLVDLEAIVQAALAEERK